ncbi:MAG: LytR C-terminal domain-containing protein [Aeromicrobium erythreum]
MTRRLPVLLGAVVVLVLGMVLGVRLLTAKVDVAEADPGCEDRTVRAGQPLTPNLVAVNVYNTSQRAGLANRVSINLQRRGFLAGDVGNLATKLRAKGTLILTDTPDDSRVKLVAAQLNDVTIRKPDVPLKEGVTVVVGDGYAGMVSKAPRQVKATQTVSVCVPIVDVD